MAQVKSVYQQLKLRKVYTSYEEDSYKDLMEHIAQLPGEGKLIPPLVFTTFLDRIYKRDV